MNVGFDDYTIPIFCTGTGAQNVLICDYDGNLAWPSPTFTEFDFWQATTQRSGQCASLGGGWEGTGLTVLTDGPATGVDDRQPNWSPAGDRILFQRRGPGSGDWDIYTIHSNHNLSPFQCPP
ncbi:MAG: hypothetical protein ACE5E7_14225 [Anaerolineae bacterium]